MNMSGLEYREHEASPIPNPRKRQIGSIHSSDSRRTDERKKVSRACDACKTKKTRCSGEQPCVRCQQMGLSCEYLAIYTRGRAPAIQTPLNLSQNESPPTPPWLPNTTSAGMGQGYTANISSRNSPVPSADVGGQYHGPSSTITFLDRAWKRFKQYHVSTGSRDIERGTSTEKSWLVLGDGQNPRLSDDACGMPSKQCASRLVAKYFEISTPFFQFLHRGTVEDWVEKLYQLPGDGQPSQGKLSTNKVTVLLMMFATSTFDQTGESQDSSSETDSLSTETFLAAAQQRLQSETGAPNLESVQARLIECLYLLSTPRANEAYFKFGTTASMIVTLGLHRRKRRGGYKFEIGPIEHECRKRAFWAAYTIDRYLSVMGGRPRIIQNFDTDQDFPEKVNDEDLTATGIRHKPEPFDSLMDAPIMHAKLARIIGQTSAEVYPLQSQSQEESYTRQRSTNELAAWRAQLPYFLGLVPASSLIPVFQRQSIILRLAHAHAVIHANRPFLLRNFADQPGRSPSSHQHLRKYIYECVDAARDVVDVLDNFPGSGIPFDSWWFTQYVSFCAVAVLYIYTIQQHQNTISTPSDTASVMASMTNRDLVKNKDYFALAEHCQRRLARAAKDNSPGKTYDIVLEELRQEVHRHMQTSESNADGLILGNGHRDPQQSLGEGGEALFMAEMGMDIPNIVDNWSFPEWVQSDYLMYAGMPEDQDSRN